MTDYTMTDLQHEIKRARATIRKAYKMHKSCRVYFDTPRIIIGDHVSLQIPFQVSDNGRLLTPDYHNIAL